MNVTVNGESVSVADRATIRKLLETLGLGEERVAVEVNREIVPRAEHVNHVLEDGDALEIVHFVGGG